MMNLRTPIEASPVSMLQNAQVPATLDGTMTIFVGMAYFLQQTSTPTLTGNNQPNKCPHNLSNET